MSNSRRIVQLAAGMLVGLTGCDATGTRQIADPTPYSAVVPKMAAVALFDSGPAGTRVERMQRTLLFGDAATSAGGSPTIVDGPAGSHLFCYQATDRETVDVPRLPTALDGPQFLVLLNYLVNGQVIATACPVQ